MNTKIFIQELDTLLSTYKSYQNSSKYNDLSDMGKPERQSLVTRTIVSIHRISGANSLYSKEIERNIQKDPELHIHTSTVMGIAQALREDINAGYLQNLVEVAHANIFSDFLDMARHLVDNNYKDAAAVITGSTLESHLKKLSLKNAITIEVGGKPVKADKLNADLAKAGIYNPLDQKNVTAWLGLRNSAAHGQYGEYSPEQVNLFISSMQDFITRNPA